ncbi:MAG: hypothetical protein LBF12_00760 [Christensenellaceae bacterium]|jgi:hypothetical protein|nr:hypothetical protein [Christensenellaceae bacterium]
MVVDVVDGFTGRLLKIKEGIIEVHVTLDCGPRIIWLSKEGGDNIMFNDLDEQITKDVSSLYGRRKKWRIYGGHRIWLAPETDETYYPDDEPVRFEVGAKGVKFYPPVRMINDAQIQLGISFESKNVLKIDSEVVYKGDDELKCALWGLSVFKSGGRMRLALNAEDTGYLPNRNIVFWPYSDMKDPRFILTNEFLELKSDKQCEKPFKVGLYQKNFQVDYEIKTELGITKIEKRIISASDGSYPDYSCNFESYISNLIHEIETLTPFSILKNGQNIKQVEYWTIS